MNKFIVGCVAIGALLSIVFAGQQPERSRRAVRMPSEPSNGIATTTPSPAITAGPTPTTRTYIRAAVVRVTDGDTIVTTAGKVRLLAIDTPEVYNFGHVHPECGGKEASAAMKRLLLVGDSIRLHPDPEQGNTDRYGRLLRYVYKTRPGSDDIGAELVREGWAEVYLAFPTSKTNSYLKLQAVASNHDRGVWGLCGGFES
jgi:micrococcal nuclease